MEDIDFLLDYNHDIKKYLKQELKGIALFVVVSHGWTELGRDPTCDASFSLEFGQPSTRNGTNDLFLTSIMIGLHMPNNSATE